MTNELYFLRTNVFFKGNEGASNILEIVSILPTAPSSTAAAGGMSLFEEKILKELGEIKSNQRKTDERINRLESVQNKLQAPAPVGQNQGHDLSVTLQSRRHDSVGQGHSRGHGMSSFVQSRGHGSMGPSYSNFQECQPDFAFDEFEEFDANFPIRKPEQVETLEWSIRSDLEYKFRLVIRSYFLPKINFCDVFLSPNL